MSSIFKKRKKTNTNEHREKVRKDRIFFPFSQFSKITQKTLDFFSM